jgi:hypothetical protein
MTGRSAVKHPVLWSGLLLFGLFFGLYYWIGSAFAATPIFLTNNNVFFGADHLDAIQNWPRMAGEFQHEGAHPLMVLLLHPFAAVLAYLAGSELVSVLAMTAACGAASVVLCYFSCALWQRHPWRSLAPALVFGFSISQVVFGSIPETYAVVGAALAFTYFLLVAGLRGLYTGFVAWVLAGLIAFGMLITAFVQPLIAYTGVVFAREKRQTRPLWTWLLPVLYVLTVLLLAAALNWLQLSLFPGTQLFFLPTTFAQQAEFVDLTRLLEQPLAVLGEVARHLLVVNLFGFFPVPVVNGDNPDIFFAYRPADLHYSASGMAAAVLWLGLLVDGVLQNARSRDGRLYLLILGAIVLVNGAFYSVFNPEEMFLYSTTITLPLLLLAVNRRSAETPLRALAWWGLAALTGANNLAVVLRFLHYLQQT